MTQRPTVFVTILLIVGFLLSACSEPLTPAPTREPTAAAPMEEEMAESPEAEEEMAESPEAEEETDETAAVEEEEATPEAEEETDETTAATDSEPAASGETQTAIIGFSASLTGKFNVESTRQNNGLTLWMDQVNEAGGIQLEDGSTVMFESKFYDDESNKDRVQELYTRLSTEDNANFLISPYSSGLTEAAAVIAEQNGRIMITTGAADDQTYQQGYTLVYQTYTPASRYLTGAIDLVAEMNPDLTKIAIVHENDKFSTSVVEAAQAYAEEQGYEIVLFEGYDSGTTDFAPIINKVQQSQPEAILGGGHFQDGSTLAKQIYEKNVPVQFMALLVAPPEPNFAEIGDAAIGVVGPSQWEPLASYTAESAEAADMEWFGPEGDEFVEAYQAAYDEEPSYHAAGGYVSGLILQKAIEQAGSIETEAVQAALDEMSIMTFYGGIAFDTSEEMHGLQTGHEMVYVQWQQDDSGNLMKQIVWPEDVITSEAISIAR